MQVSKAADGRGGTTLVRELSVVIVAREVAFR